MAISLWVYRRSDGQFLRGGFYVPTFDLATDGVAEMPADAPHPDPRTQRWDSIASAVRNATAQEIAAYDTAQRQVAADRDGALDVVKTTIVWHLERELGRLPTPAEALAAFNRWKQIHVNAPWT
jgi:hypothetical protein